MQDEKTKVIMEDENGEQTELTIYFTYHSENFDKDYVIFADPTDENGLVAGMVDESGEIIDIESEEEYLELDDVIASYQEEHPDLED